MAGDTETDMEFGRRLGMINVLIGGEQQRKSMDQALYDYLFPDLLSFTGEMKKYYL